ncbi:MAG: hypothetical protein ABEI57_01155 [Halapricum sp.]
MPTKRRSLLAVFAAALGGCLTQPEEPPRSVVTPGNYTEPKPPESTSTPLPKPEIVTQDLVRGPDGGVVIVATLDNQHTVASAGTLYAEIEFNGTTDRYASTFELDAGTRGKVNVSAPIDYDAFLRRPNLVLSISAGTPTDRTTVDEHDS